MLSFYHRIVVTFYARRSRCTIAGPPVNHSPAIMLRACRDCGAYAVRALRPPCVRQAFAELMYNDGGAYRDVFRDTHSKILSFVHAQN